MTDAKAASSLRQDNQSLRPLETVQRVLISTTSYFVGEFSHADLLVTHAWPGFGDRSARHRMSEGPNSRSAFVAAFVTEDYQKAPGVMVPQYAGLGETFAAGMSVLFGKRFDAHGSLQNSGSFNVPDLSAFSTPCQPHLPHNTHRPRADIAIPLRLDEIGRLFPIWTAAKDVAAALAFDASARFYMRALQAAETDPELAYLHLITAGEIVSNALFPTGGSMLDPELEVDLQRIAAELSDGDILARKLRKRLFEVKRRFVSTYEALVDNAFFDQTEATEAMWAFKADGFKAAIGAAYDLRSQFVHSGAAFGNWVEPTHRLNEIQLGIPVVADREMGKILARAPTILGLERATRCVILNFAAKKLNLDLSITTQAAD